MEHCELESLREYMNMNNGLSENELNAIASYCLLGLNFLHSHYIIHGVVEYRNDKCIEHQTIESALR